MHSAHTLPCVAVLSDGVIAVIKSTIVVTWAFLWQNTAVALKERKEDVKYENVGHDQRLQLW